MFELFAICGMCGVCGCGMCSVLFHFCVYMFKHSRIVFFSDLFTKWCAANTDGFSSSSKNWESEKPRAVDRFLLTFFFDFGRFNSYFFLLYFFFDERMFGFDN